MVEVARTPGSRPRPRVVLDAMQVRDMAVQAKTGKAYHNEDISRVISTCREQVYSAMVRSTDARRSKADLVMGGEVFLRRCFHTTELYQTHVVGRKIASSHAPNVRAGGGLGCVCRG